MQNLRFKSELNGLILDKYDVKYYHCPSCGFICTEDPYWLDEAYSDAIAVSDTGIMRRNISIAMKLAVILSMNFKSSDAFVDVAGGYGIMTRIMRDMGFSYYWADKYCVNLVARGYEADRNKLESVSAISAFEVIEHLIDPVGFINEQFKQYNCETLIFSTLTYGHDIPDHSWWYYSFKTGQHISLFGDETLNVLASKLNCKIYKFGGLFVITRAHKFHFLTSLFTRFFFPLSLLKYKTQPK
jgi:Methyltransferase domain